MAVSASSKILASDMSGVIKALSVSGKVITYTKVDGSTGTITTQDTNTTYSAGTGLSLSSNKFSLASLHSAAATLGSSSAQTLSYSGTFTIPYVTRDVYGRVSGGGTRKITMPAAPTATVFSNVAFGYYGGAYNATYSNHNDYITLPSGGTWAYIKIGLGTSSSSSCGTTSGGSKITVYETETSGDSTWSRYDSVVAIRIS